MRIALGSVEDVCSRAFGQYCHDILCRDTPSSGFSGLTAKQDGVYTVGIIEVQGQTKPAFSV